MYAPLALFLYNRPDHTKLTIEALQKNSLAADTDIYIYSDAPKNADDELSVKKVREYIQAISGFRNIKILERSFNMGLAASIISGVTEIVARHGKIIVLEDDMVTSPYFLKYMNEALDLYEQEENVISIHGYMYPVKVVLPETLFLQGADCWGWATWKRGWDLFEKDSRKLLDELKKRKLTSRFDFNNSYPYTQMLEDQIEGKVNSWAIRWYASAFLKEKFTLYPGQSLLSNIGVDGSGIHCEPNDNYLTHINNRPVDLKKISVETDQKAFNAISDFFKPEKKRKFSVKEIIKKYFN